MQAEAQQNIVTTARRLFEQYGIKSVSMDDICHELGMSKKTLYQYFSQKDDLVLAVLGNISEEVETKVNEFLQSDTSMWDVLIGFVEKAKMIPDVRKIPPFFYDLNKYYPMIAAEHNRCVERKNVETMSLIIRRGIKEGVFRADLDVELTAYLFARMHSSSIEESVKNDNQGYPARRIMDFAFDVLIRGILSAEGLQKYEEIIE